MKVASSFGRLPALPDSPAPVMLHISPTTRILNENPDIES